MTKQSKEVQRQSRGIDERQHSRELAYEKGRSEIVAEVRIDPVIKIKDQAEKMRLYAIRREDKDLEAWVSAVALRAHYHIGKISKGLETGAGPGRGKKTRPTDGTPFKWETLKAAGISKSAAARAEQLTAIISEAEIEKLCRRAAETGEAAPSAVAIHNHDRHQRLKAKFAKIEHELPPDLHVGDFRQLASVIPTASVELIFTDPPYDNESIPLYEAAAIEAARILKPGGSLITYCGHLQLPLVLPAMAAQLRYYWIGAHVHDGGPMSRMAYYGIIAGFKPLLWFVKDFRADVQTFVADTVLSKTREKDVHPWQQSIVVAEHFISSLVPEGGTVVDFFAGGGTTIIAAQNLSRRWIAFEIDESCIPGINDRLKRAAA